MSEVLQSQENEMDREREYLLAINSEEGIDEQHILSHPWALDLMRTVKRISKQYVLNWCNGVIKLGEDTIDVNKWTDIFSSQIEQKFQELNTDIRNLQIKALDHIQELLKELERLCKDLHIPMLKVYNRRSLYEEQRFLMNIIEEYAAKVNVKRKEFHDLRLKQMDLCKSLEKEPIILPESPLPTAEQLSELQEYIERLQEEKFIREERYMQLKNEIIAINNELLIDASLDFEREILSTTLADFQVTETNMEQLEKYHQSLFQNLKSVREEISHIRAKVDSLWEMLDVDIIERDSFRQQHTGNSLKTLKALKHEYQRLEDMKKQNIAMFVDKRRQELQNLWDQCHCDGSQKNEFQFFYADAYNEDLLELHDREIEKWNTYYEKNKEIIKVIEEHKSLWDQLLELENNAESANRYKNRGGQLLLEEKARNKLSKKIPELEERMQKLAMIFNVTHGYPFKTFGRTIEEHIQLLHDRREEEKKLKLSSKKQHRDKTITPAKSMTSVLPGSSTVRGTPASARAIITPVGSRNKKVLKDSCKKKMNAKSPRVPVIKVAAVGPARRLSAERRRKIEKSKSQPGKMPLRANQDISEDSKENYDDTTTTEYDAFERDLSNKGNCRSTLFQNSNNSCDEDRSARKRKGATQCKTAPGTPKTAKMEYLKLPNANKYPPHTPSKGSARTPLKAITTPIKTPSRAAGSTPSRTPRRTPKTPSTQTLRAATSNLKLIF